MELFSYFSAGVMLCKLQSLLDLSQGCAYRLSAGQEKHFRLGHMSAQTPVY